MNVAEDYNEHLNTGMLWWEDIPDHLKSSFWIAWDMVDTQLKKTLKHQGTTMKDQPTHSYVHIMTNIFSTSNWFRMLRNLYFACEHYPKLLGRENTNEEGCWFSFRQVAYLSSPINNPEICPMCGATG